MSELYEITLLGIVLLLYIVILIIELKNVKLLYEVKYESERIKKYVSYVEQKLTYIGEDQNQIYGMVQSLYEDNELKDK